MLSVVITSVVMLNVSKQTLLWVRQGAYLRGEHLHGLYCTNTLAYLAHSKVVKKKLLTLDPDFQSEWMDICRTF